MPNYSIEWSRLVDDMLPAVLRKPRLRAFMNALISPVVTLGRNFQALRVSISAELPIGPELRVMRHHLNERYDFLDRRFRIVDGTASEPVRVYTDAEDQPLYLPRFLSAQRIDFTVFAPAAAQNFDRQTRAFLDKYKLLTKTYTIIYE